METQPPEPRRQHQPRTGNRSGPRSSGQRGHLILTRRPKKDQDTIILTDSRTGERTTIQINRVVGQKVSVSIVAAAAVVIEREEISFRENNSTSH